MTVVSNPVPAPADNLSKAIARLRSLTQHNIQNGWRYCDEDLPIAQATQPNTWQDWPIAPLNDRDHIAWTKGKHVRWLGQLITVPHDLQQFSDEYATLAESLSPLNPPILGDFDSGSPQSWGARRAKVATGYPLEGLTLRLAVTWWADNAQLFVNGKLVQEGDIFDCMIRILLSKAVIPGDTFAIALRLVSPGHDDGALVRSFCHYESATDIPEPSFIADELDILRLYLQTFAPAKLNLLTEAVSQIDWSTLPPYTPHPTPHTPSLFNQSLANLRDRLLPLSSLLKQRRIRLLGHAHLDMAWLWPIVETWNAAERTFESALKLQKDFSELIFCHSTPALYEWIEQNRPALFEQIQQAIADGWWEPVGGLWVEPELNLISGESIVRHILYGQRYFQEKFGSINRLAWLPDSFGFTWQLPQILKQGGIDYFVTQKLRWNDTTKFPYEVFQWQAPDHTEIFSLMSAPIGEGIDSVKMATYACDWETKTGIPDVLWLPGVGDHGGGPTRDMLEIARRWQQSPFFPQLEFSTALNYLQDLEANYTLGAPPSIPADVQNIANAPQSITSEAQPFIDEAQPFIDEAQPFADAPQSINAEPQSFVSEPQSTTHEAQSINAEAQSINAEAQSFIDARQSINAEAQPFVSEPQSINAEAQNINSLTQNSKLQIHNSKLFPPHSPLPTPHSLPKWNSDLYLEFHRGCYTTHADQKRHNRHFEELLYQAELYASLATIITNASYPKAELEAAWKKVLFNQFHDILPGSAIEEVYEDANQGWIDVTRFISLENALKAITSKINLPSPPHPNARVVAIFNPCSWERSAIVNTTLTEKFVDIKRLTDFDEYEMYYSYNWQIYTLEGQKVEASYCIFDKLPDRYIFCVNFLAENVPALGYRCFWVYPHSEQTDNISFEMQNVLENKFLRVEVNPATGNLSGIFDKVHQREILDGEGNQLQAFRDEGQYWDAWNIDPNFEKYLLLPSELLSIGFKDGTLMDNSIAKSVVVRRRIGQSIFEQTYLLERESPILRIDTSVDWRERHILVKAAFPLKIEADFATYEIPCGVIQRTTKPETEAEKAQWEVPAMHWADLSDGNYGVSILNDCKYGYDAKPNQLRLTLLRGSEWPDPDADKGQHSFTYALYPHAGNWKTAQTVKHGYELNMPLIAQVIPASGDNHNKTLPPTASLLDLGADNLVLMAFKQSEDSPDEWILRCYEAHGEEAQLNFQNSLGLELGERMDLLERSTDAQTTKGQTVTVHPWEIASFKVKRSANTYKDATGNVPTA